MGLKICALEMAVGEGVPAPAPPAGLAALLSAFASTWLLPRRVVISSVVPRRALVALTRLDPERSDGAFPLWSDEEIDPGSAVTRCRERGDLGLIQELAAALATNPSDHVEIEVTGAVAIRPRGAEAAQWCGRWRSEPARLDELVAVRFVCRPDIRAMRIRFELSGYPLVAVTPTPERLVRTDERSAWLNRRHLIPAIAQAPAALGLASDRVQWSLEDGDFRSLYTESARALEQWWMPALASGRCDPDAEPEPADPARMAALTAALTAASEADATTWLAHLAGSAEQRAVALGILAREPSGDAAVARAIELLLHDDTLVLLQVPFRFGPLNLLAARALAAERRAAGARDIVRIRSTPAVSATELIARETRAGLPPIDHAHDPARPHDGMLARYARLRDLEILAPDEYVIDANTALDDLAPPPIDEAAPPATAAPVTAPPDRAAQVARALLQLNEGGARRAWALEDLVHEPINDPAVVAAITEALSDPTPCVLDGVHLGEVRLLAAAALAAVRAAAHDITPIHARFVPPLAPGRLLDLMQANPAPDAPPLSDSLTCFAWLRARRVLRETEHALRHPVDIAALARLA